MKSLWAEWKSVSEKIKCYPHKLIFLDFDGTLTPISKNPHVVVLDKDLKEIILNLNRKKDWTVIIISGRSLKNLKSYFRSANLIYAGNHGLELQGKDRGGRGLVLPPAARIARQNTRAMRLLAQKLKSAFYFWPGVYVENKIYTVSVHFRNLRDDRKPAFNEMIRFFKEKYSNSGLVWRRGKKVWEIRPYPEWGKGNLTLYLMSKFPGALPIAVGDDLTDEEMFAALKGKGISIRVGRSKRTYATKMIPSQRQVRKLLGKLCR